MSIYEQHRLADGRLPFILHDYRIPAGGTGCYSNWHENIEILYFMEGASTLLRWLFTGRRWNRRRAIPVLLLNIGTPPSSGTR